MGVPPQIVIGLDVEIGRVDRISNNSFKRTRFACRLTQPSCLSSTFNPHFQSSTIKHSLHIPEHFSTLT